MKRFGLVLATVGASLQICQAGVPLTDLVVYGRVYYPTNHQQVIGLLPSPITVKINSATGPTNTVIASTSILVDSGNGLAQYYVLRIRRFEIATARQAADAFVMPGDVLHIFYNGSEAAETETTSVLVTDALGDLRFLDLNAPPNPDTDSDGLPDDWERRYFGGSLTNSPNDSLAGDGINLRTAYALGLDPRVNNRSRMPFLTLEQGTNVVYYFRQSAEITGLTYEVQANDVLSVTNWSLLPGVNPQQIGQDGNSLILKVTVPGGLDRPKRFLRLNIH